MTHDLSSHRPNALPPNKRACMTNGEEARLLFQLLRLADLSMSLASHLTSRVSGKIPSLTPC